MGRGGQRFVESDLLWNRGTIRKGERELSGDADGVDRFGDRGRKRCEHHLPGLMESIQEIVEPRSQTDPTFRSTRQYTPLTAQEVLNRLGKMEAFREQPLPCERTIRNKLADLGFSPKKVAKCKPLRKIAQTDAIFEEVHRINAEADADPTQLRISLDTKATVKLGELSRGGKSRQPQKALDHDMEPEGKLSPFGLFLPETKESFFWFATGKVTADFMVDRLKESLPAFKERCPQLQTLVINADNGPESSGRRTQWLHRLCELAVESNLNIQLAYYPPYHSKYNPVERCWGVLENHWRGELLESVEKTLGLARTMTYAGVKPVVRLVRKAYKAGVTLGKSAMRLVESRLDRKPGLEPWFIHISPTEPTG